MNIQKYYMNKIAGIDNGQATEIEEPTIESVRTTPIETPHTVSKEVDVPTTTPQKKTDNNVSPQVKQIIPATKRINADGTYNKQIEMWQDMRKEYNDYGDLLTSQRNTKYKNLGDTQWQQNKRALLAKKQYEIQGQLSNTDLNNTFMSDVVRGTQDATKGYTRIPSASLGPADKNKVWYRTPEGKTIDKDEFDAIYQGAHEQAISDYSKIYTDVHGMTFIPNREGNNMLDRGSYQNLTNRFTWWGEDATDQKAIPRVFSDKYRLAPNVKRQLKGSFLDLDLAREGGTKHKSNLRSKHMNYHSNAGGDINNTLLALGDQEREQTLYGQFQNKANLLADTLAIGASTATGGLGTAGAFAVSGAVKSVINKQRNAENQSRAQRIGGIVDEAGEKKVYDDNTTYKTLAWEGTKGAVVDGTLTVMGGKLFQAGGALVSRIGNATPAGKFVQTQFNRAINYAAKTKVGGAVLDSGIKDQTGKYVKNIALKADAKLAPVKAAMNVIDDLGYDKLTKFVPKTVVEGIGKTVSAIKNTLTVDPSKAADMLNKAYRGLNVHAGLKQTILKPVAKQVDKMLRTINPKTLSGAQTKAYENLLHTVKKGNPKDVGSALANFGLAFPNLRTIAHASATEVVKRSLTIASIAKVTGQLYGHSLADDALTAMSNNDKDVTNQAKDMYNTQTGQSGSAWDWLKKNWLLAAGGLYLGSKILGGGSRQQPQNPYGPPQPQNGWSGWSKAALGAGAAYAAYSNKDQISNWFQGWANGSSDTNKGRIDVNTGESK